MTNVVRFTISDAQNGYIVRFAESEATVPAEYVARSTGEVHSIVQEVVEMEINEIFDELRALKQERYGAEQNKTKT